MGLVRLFLAERVCAACAGLLPVVRGVVSPALTLRVLRSWGAGVGHLCICR